MSSLSKRRREWGIYTSSRKALEGFHEIFHISHIRGISYSIMGRRRATRTFESDHAQITLRRSRSSRGHDTYRRDHWHTYTGLRGGSTHYAIARFSVSSYRRPSTSMFTHVEAAFVTFESHTRYIQSSILFHGSRGRARKTKRFLLLR